MGYKCKINLFGEGLHMDSFDCLDDAIIELNSVGCCRKNSIKYESLHLILDKNLFM